MSNAKNKLSRVLSELQKLHEELPKELAIQRSETSSETTRSQRLQFLLQFQCDLLPGITGKTQDLGGQAKRENAQSKTVSHHPKVAGYVYVSLACLGMLFYIMLFALQ